MTLPSLTRSLAKVTGSEGHPSRLGLITLALQSNLATSAAPSGRAAQAATRQQVASGWNLNYGSINIMLRALLSRDSGCCSAGDGGSAASPTLKGPGRAP